MNTDSSEASTAQPDAAGYFCVPNVPTCLTPIYLLFHHVTIPVCQ